MTPTSQDAGERDDIKFKMTSSPEWAIETIINLRAQLAEKEKELNNVTTAHENSLKVSQAKTNVAEDYYERISALEQQLKAIRKQTDEWQLIKTAPKDGTEFVALWKHQGCVKQLISWNKIHGYWQSKGKPELNMQASHWLKLPALSPTTAEEESK